MTPQEMRVLYDYNAWANHRSLNAASSLTAEQFVKPMGSSFGSVRDTLGHIYGGEWIWLERFQGRSPASLPDTTQFKDVASLLERWNELETRLLTFVRGLTQTDLDRVMEYKTLKYGVYSNPLWLFSLRGNNPNHCVDERSGAASACGEPHHRAGADNGRASCGTFVADRTGAAGVLAGHCIHFC